MSGPFEVMMRRIVNDTHVPLARYIIEQLTYLDATNAELFVER